MREEFQVMLKGEDDNNEDDIENELPVAFPPNYVTSQPSLSPPLPTADTTQLSLTAFLLLMMTKIKNNQFLTYKRLLQKQKKNNF